MWALLFIIAGVVLQKNEEWFNGADTVGAILFWVGLGVFLMWAVITFVYMLLAIGSARSYPRKKGRRW